MGRTEEAVHEQSQADDDQEPADANPLPFRTDKPEQRHEAEPDRHDHDAARAKPRRGTAVLQNPADDGDDRNDVRREERGTELSASGD